MSNSPLRIAVITPCLNDSASLEHLIPDLATGLDQHHPHLIVVDDGSYPAIDLTNLPKIPVTILQLKTNMGHQRAIAIGMAHAINSNTPFDRIAVMDSDGEDDPLSLTRMMAAISPNHPFVFARRSRRSEGTGFKLGYRAYRMLFGALLGMEMRFGNFSIFDAKVLSHILNQPQCWNHYSASVISGRVPFTSIDVNRKTRYDGESKMNWASLMQHGFSALSVFYGKVLLRLGIVCLLLIAILLSSASAVAFNKWVAGEAILGWTSTLLSIFFIGLINVTSLLFSLLMNSLSNRAGLSEPIDSIAPHYISKVKEFNL